ncbi:integrative conjugative element protein, RAQPRD family [Enterobacter cloacae]|uniref:Integrative conjugative element protein, RAQPRD family n=1 Tax=Enterobacter cloacae TaxID=550 RepID=A0A377M9B5_ENTCL|nr:integrative conjugative element protein, RAQPRD family [Enterobacter cloacae]
MPHTRILTALLMAVLPALQCHASEKDELALVMRQLDQVQAGLDRARVVANQTQDARFYFDYQQATRDITTMKQGISTYLEPSARSLRHRRLLSPDSTAHRHRHGDERCTA